MCGLSLATTGYFAPGRLVEGSGVWGIALLIDAAPFRPVAFGSQDKSRSLKKAKRNRIFANGISLILALIRINFQHVDFCKNNSIQNGL